MNTTGTAGAGGDREVTAAVVRTQGSFDLETAYLGPPRDDEVLVRVVAAGLCHTDLVVRDQVYPVALPIVPFTRAPASSRQWERPCRRSHPATTSR